MLKPRYQCINICAKSVPYEWQDAQKRKKLLDWLNNYIHSEYERIEDLSDGLAYAQLMEYIFPGSVELRNIKFCNNSENDCVENLKLLEKSFKWVGCHEELPIHRLARSIRDLKYQFEFLLWFKEFFEANFRRGEEFGECQKKINSSNSSTTTSIQEITSEVIDNDSETKNANNQLVLLEAPKMNHYRKTEFRLGTKIFSSHRTLIDHAWSKRVLELVGNKAKLMESFSWLSTLGGGFSALGERDPRWSMRAGALSLGQQLQLAQLLGDERLKVMCHLFACLAALQMENRHFCVNYIRRVVVPLIKKLPHQDQIIKNILVHIVFRVSQFELKRGQEYDIAPKGERGELIIGHIDESGGFPSKSNHVIH